MKLEGAGCSSTVPQVHGIKYSHVCGKVIGYQDITTDAFNHPERCPNIIDGNYINGVSIIHGYYSRKHMFGPLLLPIPKVTYILQEHVPAHQCCFSIGFVLLV